MGPARYKAGQVLHTAGKGWDKARQVRHIVEQVLHIIGEASHKAGQAIHKIEGV